MGCRISPYVHFNCVIHINNGEKVRYGRKIRVPPPDSFFQFCGGVRARVTSAEINFSIPYGLSFVLICPVASVAPVASVEQKYSDREIRKEHGRVFA